MTYALFFVISLSLSGGSVAAVDDPAQAPVNANSSDVPQPADASVPSEAPMHPKVVRGGTPRVIHPGSPGTIEERVRYFTKNLNLDVTQQAKLRRILEDQRDGIRRIWSNPMVSPADRAPATLAANKRTGDEIRSILNDEQKQKYNPPAPSTPPIPGDKRTVEDWLDLTRPR
jgi:hypothetical protein